MYKKKNSSSHANSAIGNLVHGTTHCYKLQKHTVHLKLPLKEMFTQCRLKKNDIAAPSFT